MGGEKNKEEWIKRDMEAEPAENGHPRFGELPTCSDLYDWNFIDLLYHYN